MHSPGIEIQNASQAEIDEAKKISIEGKFHFIVDGINSVEAITLPEGAESAEDISSFSSDF